MTAEEAVARLVLAGAAMTPTVGGVPVPVGLMQQLAPGRWFWWAAGGDTEFDGHVVRANVAKVLYDGLAVEFRREGELVGYLTTIDEAVEDEEGRRQARGLLDMWKFRYERDADLRGFIVRRMAEA